LDLRITSTVLTTILEQPQCHLFLLNSRPQKVLYSGSQRVLNWQQGNPGRCGWGVQICKELRFVFLKLFGAFNFTLLAIFSLFCTRLFTANVDLLTCSADRRALLDENKELNLMCRT